MSTENLTAIETVLNPPPRHWVGNGFYVHTFFPTHRLPLDRMSPFHLLDYNPPHQFEPGVMPRGVGQHPHRGFETVTLALQGSLAHRDSAGHSDVIEVDEVQWMTAGAGVIHEEFHHPSMLREGGVLQMVQLWVNLPARHKMTAPAYQAIRAADMPCIDMCAGRVQVRLVAGDLFAQRGPAHSFTRLQLADVRMRAGAQLHWPILPHNNSGLLLMHGEVRINEARSVQENQFVVFARAGAGCQLRCLSDARFLWLSGEPIAEPVVQHGPFVMNTREEIHQAIADYSSGRMGRFDSE